LVGEKQGRGVIKKLSMGGGKSFKLSREKSPRKTVPEEISPRKGVLACVWWVVGGEGKMASVRLQERRHLPGRCHGG